MIVRATGFPLDGLLQLAASETLSMIDELLDAEATALDRRERAIGAVKDALHRAEGDARKPLRRLFEQLRADQLPVSADAAFADWLVPLREAREVVAARRGAVDRAFASEQPRIRAALRRAAADERFQEALLWQNPGALATGVAPLLRRRPDESDSETRRLELLIARYLQRYCAKNDTIGFFGPVGWADLREEGPPMRLSPGSSLLATRTVYFEFWCIDALASRLAEDPDVRPHLSPRRMPTVRVEDSILHYPVARQTRVPPQFARLLAACDGERSARAIAAELVADESLELGDESEVFALLDELVERKLATWTLEVPTASFDGRPERQLRRILEGIPNEPVRLRSLAALDELEAARDRVSAAAGNTQALREALSAFESTFARLCQVSTTRRSGEMFAGRTPLFEDCRRDLALELGPACYQKLSPALSLLLQSARWYTHEIASRYSELFHSLHRELDGGDGAVDYLTFHSRAAPHFATQFETSSIVGGVVTELQRRWASLLEIPENAKRVERSVAELKERVAASFAAPQPGWPMARFQSPDVMLAAESAEALARGELSFVLGEIHVGLHSANTPLFLKEHPDPDPLVRARRIDLGRVGVAPIEARRHASRADIFSRLPDDIDVEMGDGRSQRNRSQVVAAADLLVENHGGILEVRSRDGRRRFDLIEVMEMYLVLASCTHFTVLGGAAHTPRVTIGNLVVNRESWSFRPDELPFLKLDGLERLVAARRWAKQAGLPRFVFCRVPEEPKPCYIDFGAPVFVELLTKLARKASRVQISEMLPAATEAWLPDASGRIYTSELRIAAVDPVPWTAAKWGPRD
jgi:hypothetical protein